ncbi:MAG: NADH-quinone oxidoreductase subunit L [Acidimicrobiia bacterium]|nr:NADH-quinone oxidoreductase subunit L [Acidimicrobiia bacterium]
MQILELFWLLPVVNIIACLLAFFFGKTVSRGKAQVWTLPAIAFSWVMSILGAVAVIGDSHLAHEGITKTYKWFEFGPDMFFQMGIHIDGFAVVMCLVVTTISMMVQIYSIGYMRGEPRYVEFYAVLAVFTAGMLILVTADNLFLGIFGWEIMGLTSYLLIGHYYEKRENSNAAIKAFITTKTGDVGLIIGAVVVYWATETFNFGAVNAKALEGEFHAPLLLVACIALFIGVIGKSAQFPLHTWLPDAMAGPTPVSALIHAATMVVAGVYLVARMWPTFVTAMNVHIANVNLIALIGAITAIIAALLALVQFDLKKVLAYSTVSQLGYMIFALGIGAWGAGVFHLFTHAFFKALLFLGAGSVIHSVHSNDMRDMGGLRRIMPRTYWTWIVGTLALCGVFPMAGFFSKDEILASAYHNGYKWVWAIGLAVAFLTAFYMFRATHLTFHKNYRGHGHPHESEGLITGPLIFLAIPSAIIGFIGAPGSFNLFEKWATPAAVEETIAKYPVLHPHPVDTTTFVLAGISVALALLGVLVATVVFYWEKTPGDIVERVAPIRYLHRFLANKYFLDHLYGGIVYGIRKPIADACYWFNQNVIDQVLNLTAAGTLELGKGTYLFDQNVLDGFYNGSAVGTDRIGGFFRKIQTGNIQQYAAVFFAAMALLALALVFAVR